MKATQIGLLLVAALAAGALVLSQSSAQPASRPAPATRVAACDVVEVFNNYQRAKDLTARLEEKRKAITAENDQRKKAIDAVNMELSGLKEGSPEHEKRLGEMQRLEIERKAYLQFQEAVVMREHHRLTRDMYDQIRKVVAQVAREQGYQIVLYRERDEQPTESTPELLQLIERRKVLYCDDSVDVTAAVLGKLNQSYAGEGK